MNGPHIERTHFEPQSPPMEVTLYFCPACGRRISGTYNLDPAKKSCTKTWHLAEPVPQTYIAGHLPPSHPRGQEKTG